MSTEGQKRAPGRPRGRPLGSGHGTQIVRVLRNEIRKSFDLLHDQNKPIHVLLAREIEKDACKSLNLLSKFLPQEVTFAGDNASEFAVALGQVAAKISEQNELIKENAPETIDVTPDEIYGK